LIIQQSGKVKTIIPELATHFEDDMIILEKWSPKKPISVVYFEGEKEKYFVKRFLIDNENKEDTFITEHPKSQVEIVATDYRPVAEVIFAKIKGVQKESQVIDFEDFISVKGIKALGNQVTADKIKQVNLLESLPFDIPEEVIPEDKEVIDEIEVNPNVKLGDDGQINLFEE
jgi:topoisomerase-4 subunit A